MGMGDNDPPFHSFRIALQRDKEETSAQFRKLDEKLKRVISELRQFRWEQTITLEQHSQSSSCLSNEFHQFEMSPTMPFDPGSASASSFLASPPNLYGDADSIGSNGSVNTRVFRGDAAPFHSPQLPVEPTISFRQQSGNHIYTPVFQFFPSAFMNSVMNMDEKMDYANYGYTNGFRNSKVSIDGLANESEFVDLSVDTYYCGVSNYLDGYYNGARLGVRDVQSGYGGMNNARVIDGCLGSNFGNVNVSAGLDNAELSSFASVNKHYTQFHHVTVPHHNSRSLHENPPLYSTDNGVERTVYLEDLCLYYLDPQGVTQGPFLGVDIVSWFKKGFFGTDLLVRLEDAPEGTPFKELGELMPHLKSWNGHACNIFDIVSCEDNSEYGEMMLGIEDSIPDALEMQSVDTSLNLENEEEHVNSVSQTIYINSKFERQIGLTMESSREDEADPSEEEQKGGFDKNIFKIECLLQVEHVPYSDEKDEEACPILVEVIDQSLFRTVNDISTALIKQEDCQLSRSSISVWGSVVCDTLIEHGVLKPAEFIQSEDKYGFFHNFIFPEVILNLVCCPYFLLCALVGQFHFVFETDDWVYLKFHPYKLSWHKSSFEPASRLYGLFIEKLLELKIMSTMSTLDLQQEYLIDGGVFAIKTRVQKGVYKHKLSVMTENLHLNDRIGFPISNDWKLMLMMYAHFVAANWLIGLPLVTWELLACISKNLKVLSSLWEILEKRMYYAHIFNTTVLIFLFIYTVIYILLENGYVRGFNVNTSIGNKSEKEEGITGNGPKIGRLVLLMLEHETLVARFWATNIMVNFKSRRVERRDHDVDGWPGYKDGPLWQFVDLLPLLDSPRHDSAETIRGAFNLYVNVKLITEDQLSIGKKIGRWLGMGANKCPSSAVLSQDSNVSMYSFLMDELFEKADVDYVTNVHAFKKVNIGVVVIDLNDDARSATNIVPTVSGIGIIVFKWSQQHMDDFEGGLNMLSVEANGSVTTNVYHLEITGGSTQELADMQQPSHGKFEENGGDSPDIVERGYLNIQA